VFFFLFFYHFGHDKRHIPKIEGDRLDLSTDAS